MESDWDLFAIIRGSSSSSSTSSGRASTPVLEPRALSDDFSLDDSSYFFDLGFRNDCFFGNSYNVGTLDELFKLDFGKDDEARPDVQQPRKDELCDLSSSSSSAASSSLCSLPGGVLSSNLQTQSTTTTTTVPKTSAFKRRRKNQLKKVRQVPEDSLTSSEDTCSWRKYGQKPIKGSPYPRGYYKCSTLKGCPARKQVERNRADANMFIVTYTSEHNHPPAPIAQRNSLAGTTRSSQNQRKGKNVIVNVGKELVEQEEGPHLSSDEASEMMKMIGDDGGGGECRWSMEMEDDFFDGLDGEFENVGIGYY